jgi:hypothetical protein
MDDTLQLPQSRRIVEDDTGHGCSIDGPIRPPYGIAKNHGYFRLHFFVRVQDLVNHMISI